MRVAEIRAKPISGGGIVPPKHLCEALLVYIIDIFPEIVYNIYKYIKERGE